MHNTNLYKCKLFLKFYHFCSKDRWPKIGQGWSHESSSNKANKGAIGNVTLKQIKIVKTLNVPRCAFGRIKKKLTGNEN